MGKRQFVSERYLKFCEKGADLGKFFSFLLELGFRPTDKPGDISALDPLQYGVACHMEQLGILMTFKVRSTLYTSAATYSSD